MSGRVQLDSISFWGIYTIWHRNFRLFFKTFWVNCLAPMSEPLVYLIGFGYGFMPIISGIMYQGKEVQYLEYLAPGMIGVGVLFQSYFESSYGVFTRFFYQKIWYATLTGPVTFIEVFLGEWLWAASRGTLSGVLTGAVAASLGVYSILDLFLSLPVIIGGALVFSALGLLTTSLVYKYDHINIPIFVLIVPMFALSGTYFPMDGLPDVLKALVALLPFAGFIELLRWPLAVPSACSLLLLWLFAWGTLLSMVAYRKLFRRVFP